VFNKRLLNFVFAASLQYYGGRAKVCWLGILGNCVQLWPHVYIGLVWFGGNNIINATFKKYFSHIVAISFIGGGPGEIPPTCCKSLT
jgi:hypothetical protein